MASPQILINRDADFDTTWAYKLLYIETLKIDFFTCIDSGLVWKKSIRWESVVRTLARCHGGLGGLLSCLGIVRAALR